MSGGAIWLIAGLLLGAQELLLPGYFLLWIGLAACGTGLLTVATGPNEHWQLGIFAVLAIALVGLAAWRRRPVPDVVNAPAAGLVGATCFALGFQAGEGRVRFRDGTWRARTSDAATPLPDQPLRVIGLDGTVLLVAPISAAASASSSPAGLPP